MYKLKMNLHITKRKYKYLHDNKQERDKLTNIFQITQKILQDENTQKKNTNNSKRQIETSPPELTDNNYPPLQKNQKENQEIQQSQDQQNKTIIEETPLNEQPQPEPTIIEETPISQQFIDIDTPLDFLSPSLATNKMTTTTPDTINTSTPEIQATTTKIPQSTKNYIYNKNIMQPEIMNKQGKIIPQEKMQDVALKMTEKLARSNYRDTGFLSNAIKEMKKTEL